MINVKWRCMSAAALMHLSNVDAAYVMLLQLLPLFLLCCCWRRRHRRIALFTASRLMNVTLVATHAWSYVINVGPAHISFTRFLLPAFKARAKHETMRKRDNALILIVHSSICFLVRFDFFYSFGVSRLCCLRLNSMFVAVAGLMLIVLFSVRSLSWNESIAYYLWLKLSEMIYFSLDGLSQFLWAIIDYIVFDFCCIFNICHISIDCYWIYHIDSDWSGFDCLVSIGLRLIGINFCGIFYFDYVYTTIWKTLC